MSCNTDTDICSEDSKSHTLLTNVAIPTTDTAIPINFHTQDSLLLNNQLPEEELPDPLLLRDEELPEDGVSLRLFAAGLLSASLCRYRQMCCNATPRAISYDIPQKHDRSPQVSY